MLYVFTSAFTCQIFPQFHIIAQLSFLKYTGKVLDNNEIILFFGREFFYKMSNYTVSEANYLHTFNIIASMCNFSFQK